MFKVGDRVKLLDKGRISFDGQNNIGKVLTISKIHKDNRFEDEIGYVDVKELEGFQSGIWMSQLELVNDNKSVREELKSAVGLKNDSGKSRISLIPTDALVGMGNALKYGEQKYGTHNYRNGLAFSRLVDACMRHLSSWNEGENTDPESGLSHLDHALASLAMLKFMDVNRSDMDDRYIKEADKAEALYEEAKKIQERGR